MRVQGLMAVVLFLVMWATSAPVPAQSPAILEPFWSYGLFGDRIGNRSMEACDIGSDGRAEFVLDDRDRLVLVGWPEGTDEPHVLGQSHTLGEEINDIALWFDGTGWRVAVLYGYDHLAVLELPSFEILASGAMSFDAIRLDTADVMNGPEHEIILTGYDRSAVYDSTTIDELLPLAVTGTNLAAGNVDGDPAPELVFTGGAVIEIRNGSPLLEWTVPTTGDRVLLAELDGAAPFEIVMGDNGASAAAYSFGNPTALWGFADDNLVLISAADLTRDGRQEVLVLGGWYDELMGLHPMLGLPIWAENFEDESCQPHVLSPISIGGDLDGDGNLDLLWPSGNYDDRWLCAADAWSGDLLWKGDWESGPIRATGSGDIDGDGSIERLAAYSRQTLAVFDADETSPRARVWLGGLTGYSSSDTIDAITVGDVDRDGAAEVVVAIDGYWDGQIHELDGLTLEHERGATYPMEEVSGVDIADLDGDGWPEIGFGGGDGSDLVVGAAEGATAELEWWVPATDQGSTVQRVVVGEVDSDPALEIVAVGTNLYSNLGPGSIIIVDTDTQAIRWTPLKEFFGLDLVDLDGDGIAEILTGSETGELVALEAVGSIDELWRIPVAPGQLAGVRVYRDHFNRPVAAVSTGEQLLGLDLTTGTVSWATPILGEDVGRYDAISLVEIPGELTPGLLVGTDHSLVEIRPGDLVVFADNFESGSTSRWTSTLP